VHLKRAACNGSSFGKNGFPVCASVNLLFLKIKLSVFACPGHSFRSKMLQNYLVSTINNKGTACRGGLEGETYGLKRLIMKYRCKGTPWRSMGKWRYSPTIPHLGTARRWVASFKPLPLYPLWQSPWSPLDRALGGPKSRSGHCGAEKNLLALPGIEPRPSSSYPVATWTELSWLNPVMPHPRNILKLSPIKYEKI
jgi:hypothetical protein